MSAANKEIYDTVFIDSFGISSEDLNENLEYNTIKAWDSVGHLGMVDELEEKFSITLDADDIVDFSSYNKGKELLSKYGIEID